MSVYLPVRVYLVPKEWHCITACKHVIAGLTKDMAFDMAKENITVNAVCPGTIETELIASYKETKPDV